MITLNCAENIFTVKFTHESKYSLSPDLIVILATRELSYKKYIKKVKKMPIDTAIVQHQSDFPLLPAMNTVL